LNTPKLGARLKEARNAKGLTAEQLSELVNINPKSIWLIESGNRSTTLPTLLKFCHALDLKPSDLLSGDLDNDVKNATTEYLELFELMDILNAKDLSVLEDIIQVTIKKRKSYRNS